MAVTYPGQNNNTGDTRAKLLTLFNGEVLAAYAATNIALSPDFVTIKTISGGKTSQFIVAGTFADTDVTSHTAGTTITTSALSTNEVTITVGLPQYISSHFSKFEEALAQYDDRAQVAREHANAIAAKIDKTIFRGIYNSAVVTPLNGQTEAVEVTNSDIVSLTLTAEQKGDAIIDAVFAANAALDENNVPTMGRNFVTSPVHYYNLVQSQKAVNRDFNPMDNGSIGAGRVMNIAGVKVVSSTHLPKFEDDGITATNLVGMVFNSDVYGVLKAKDISSEVNYDFNKLVDVLTTSYMFGYGTLNPSGLAVIKSA